MNEIEKKIWKKIDVLLTEIRWFRSHRNRGKELSKESFGHQKWFKKKTLSSSIFHNFKWKCFFECFELDVDFVFCFVSCLVQRIATNRKKRIQISIKTEIVDFNQGIISFGKSPCHHFVIPIPWNLHFRKKNEMSK